MDVSKFLKKNVSFDSYLDSCHTLSRPLQLPGKFQESIICHYAKILGKPPAGMKKNVNIFGLVYILGIMNSATSSWGVFVLSPPGITILPEARI